MQAHLKTYIVNKKNLHILPDLSIARCDRSSSAELRERVDRKAKTKPNEIKGNKMSQPAVLVYKSIHCCLVYFPDVLLIFCDLGEYSDN